MAQVLDRLFLWIFTVAVLVGTAGIIFQVKKQNNPIIHINQWKANRDDKVNICNWDVWCYGLVTVCVC